MFNYRYCQEQNYCSKLYAENSMNSPDITAFRQAC